MSNVFNTKRPASVEQRVAELAKTKHARRANMAALMEEMDAKRQQEEVQKELNKSEKDPTPNEAKLMKQQALEGHMTRTMGRKRALLTAGLESRLVEEGYNILWDKVLFETIYDASWVDSEVKETLLESMYESYCEIMEGVEALIPHVITKTPNRMLQAINNVVMETASCAAKRIVKEAAEEPDKDPDTINFSLSDLEEDEFDKNIEELNTDEVVDAVKNKVLTVVQDEKEAGKKKAEMMDEIDEAKKDEEGEEKEYDDDETGDDSDTETDDDSGSDDDSEEGDVTDVEEEDPEDDSSDDDDDKDSKSKSKKKKNDDDEEDEDDTGDDDEGSEDEPDDDSGSKSKKKGSGKKGDDEDEPVEESVFDAAPAAFYEEVASLFTVIEKDVYDGSLSDRQMHLSKSSRVPMTNPIMMKRTKARSFARVLNISAKYVEMVLAKQGYQRGITPIGSTGSWWIKPLKNSTGYAEVGVSDFKYEEEVGTSNTVGGNGSSTLGGGAGINGGVGHNWGLYGNGNINASGTTGMSVSRTSQNQIGHQTKVIIRYRTEGAIGDDVINRYAVETYLTKNPAYESYVAMENLRIDNMRRKLNDINNVSLFEALMLNGRAIVYDGAVMEGVKCGMNDILNASMISAVTDYTVLETLNTMGLCNFTGRDVKTLKVALMEATNEITKKDKKIMSPDEEGKKKKVRIGTRKFKINNSKKIMSAGTDTKGKKRKGGFGAAFANAFGKK